MVASLYRKLIAYRAERSFGKTARKGLITLTDQGVVSVTNFCTGIIIARSCPREQLGLYSLGFSAILLLISVQSAVISMPYTIFSPRLRLDERSVYTGSTLLQQLVFSIMAMVILGMSGYIIAMTSKTEGLSAIILLLAVVIPFILLREYGRQLFISRLEVHSALFMDLIVVIVQISGLLYLATRGGLSAIFSYYVIAAACLMASTAFFVQIRSHCRFQFIQAVSYFKMNWSIGRWASVSGLAAIAGLHLYPWLMTASRGVEETGILAACMGIVFSVNPLIIGLGNFIAPYIMHTFAEDGVERAHEMLNKSCAMFLVIMALFSLGMFFVGGDLLKLAYGDRYAGFGGVVGIMALGLSAEIVSLPYNYGLYMLGKPKDVFKGSLINLLVTLTLGFWMLKLYGPLGVACGLLVGNSISAIYRWSVYHRNLRSSMRSDVALAAEESP